MGCCVSLQCPGGAGHGGMACFDCYEIHEVEIAEFYLSESTGSESAFEGSIEKERFAKKANH
jgi:hypothetical protein